LKSVTIGPEGGKLETDGFSLTIPEGAFAQVETLSLAIETDSVSIEEDIFSKTFRVDGIPELYYQDLRIKIKLDMTPTDSISVAVGETYTETLLDYDFMNYDYYSTEDSSGYAVANILSPFANNFSLAKSVNNYVSENSTYIKKVIVVLTSPNAVISSEGNFKIYYPNSKAVFVPIIDEYLEEAVKELSSDEDLSPEQIAENLAEEKFRKKEVDQLKNSFLEDKEILNKDSEKFNEETYNNFLDTYKLLI